MSQAAPRHAPSKQVKDASQGPEVDLQNVLPSVHAQASPNFASTVPGPGSVPGDLHFVGICPFDWTKSPHVELSVQASSASDGACAQRDEHAVAASDEDAPHLALFDAHRDLQASALGAGATVDDCAGLEELHPRTTVPVAANKKRTANSATHFVASAM